VALGEGSLTDDAWLQGGGKVGALMRAHDWSGSPLGPPAGWPQSLRTVVGLMLGSEFPMFVAWGDELGFLYNDAYAEILGAKHPAALGARFHDIWAEIWTDIWPLIEAAMAGQASYREDLPLLMNRHGFDEQTWFTFSYSPVRDESGAVAGMFCAVVETTQRVRTEQAQAFLAHFDDQLRDVASADQILSQSAELIARHLAADRVHWARVDTAADAFEVRHEWVRDGVPSLVGRHRLSDFGEALIAQMAAGATVAVVDALHDRPASPEAVEAEFGAAVRGVLAVPLIRGGVWQSALCAHTLTPRPWREDEREFIRDVGERAWTRVQRALAEAQVRESEVRLRALVNATSNVLYRMSPDWREMRQLDGRGFLSDTDSPSIAWMEAYLLPEDRPAIQAVIDRAVRDKAPFQVEHRVRQADGSIGWTFSRAIPILDEAGEIVEWFGAASDVTVRRAAEEHLRLMVNELNHRVKNSLATVQAIAAQTLRKGEIPEETREALVSRLVALAAAHDVLTARRWSGANLRELAEQAAAPYARLDGAAPFDLEGPEVSLPPKTAIALALAFHELATNAGKYGALSTPAGRVRLTWSVSEAEGERRLHLEWRETGGPPVEPPKRRGFGTRLIERGLGSELQGTVRLEYRPDGLVCTVEAHLPDGGEEAWEAEPAFA
jgi:two-component sensor histidine kinase